MDSATIHPTDERLADYTRAQTPALSTRLRWERDNAGPGSRLLIDGGYVYTFNQDAAIALLSEVKATDSLEVFRIRLESFVAGQKSRSVGCYH